MKIFSQFLLIALFVARTWAQGTLSFDNRPPTGDARVSFLTDISVGPGSFGTGVISADLFLLTLNGTMKNMPLMPTTTFRTSPVAAAFYILPTDVGVPNSSPGDSATLVMRVWKTSLGPDSPDDYLQGRSLPFTVILGTAGSPTPLNGLQPFSFGVAPEPSPFLIIAAGMLTLFVAQLSTSRARVLLKA